MAHRRDNKGRGGRLGKTVSPRGKTAEPEGGYKAISLDSLFDAYTGNFDIQASHLNDNGIYVISAGASNNGIIGKTNTPCRTIEAPSITVDMFGHVFFQPFPVKLVTHARVFALMPKIPATDEICIYLTALISKLCETGFSYSNMASWNKIKDLSVLLPYNSSGCIDLEFMHSYTHELEKGYIKQLEAYLEAEGFKDCTLTSEETAALKFIEKGIATIHEFRIGDLFDIHPTKTYGQTNRELFSINGRVPVVSNTSVNNGITNKVGLEPTEKGNMITYSDTTTSDAIFYQPFDYVGYSHVQGLYPFQPDVWTENTLLYFVVLFRKSAAGRFDYANKFNRTIASNMKVSLPVKDNGTIDYEFMETYIRAVKKKCIARIIKR